MLSRFSRYHVLVFLTLIESFAAILSERGIYFYARDYLEFGDIANLWLSLTIGLAYVCGAMLSHRMTKLLDQRAVLIGTILVQIVVNLVMAFTLWPPGFFVLNFVLAMAIGMKWPVVESYISAGLVPKAVSRVLGTFNITWASAVPIAIIAAGFMIEYSQIGMFFLGAGISTVSLIACFRLEKHPVHLDLDHPEKLTPHEHQRYVAMCQSARWNLVSSYTLMFVLAPLAPSIATKLGYPSAIGGTILMSVMEVMRVVAFALLQWRTGWHGRAGSLAAASVLVPIGFAMVLFGEQVWLVVLGQIIFGSACGVVYYAAIYYAMVTHNASVDAGGYHEALIGSGFALGPAIGLVGLNLRGVMGGYIPGMLAGLSPLVLCCLLAGFIPLKRMPAPITHDDNS